MTASALASRYAGALVDVVAGGRGAQDPQQLVGELRSFQETLASSAELRNALSSPAVAAARKKAVVARLGERLGLSRIIHNFLFVLIDRRRIEALTEIIDAFEVLLDERLGYTRAEVTSAGELDADQRARLMGELERLTGKKVRPRFRVEPQLVGGVVARIGSTVYDGSVRGRLEGLARRLAAE